MKMQIQKRLKSQAGFTMVELVLYVVLVSIMFGVAARTFMAQADSYGFISQRNGAMSDAHYAIDRISYDILRVNLDEVESFDATSISFTDNTGVSTDYHFTGTALMRGQENFLDGVKSFTVVGYDANNAETENLNAVCRFKVTIETQPKQDEGSISLTTTITPRTMMYAGFQ